MEKYETVIQPRDPVGAAAFASKLARVQVAVKVTVTRHRPRRSLKANAFFWAAVVPTFQAFMRRHGQYFEKDEIYEFFLKQFAGKPVIDPRTGEVIDTVGKRGSKMDQGEWSTFVNHCIAWMTDRFDIPMVEPEYGPERSRRRGRAVAQ